MLTACQWFACGWAACAFALEHPSAWITLLLFICLALADFLIEES